jgi:hypothetical protein
MDPLMIGLRLVHFIADVAWVGGAVVLQLASGSCLALDGSSTELNSAAPFMPSASRCMKPSS